MVDAGRRLVRPVHDHARQHGRERRAAGDPAGPRHRHLELEWVVDGYALTFATLMLTGGKLADLFGRRLMFVVGLAIFTGSSLACGLAGSASVLIGARVVQGIGAALMNPATLDHHGDVPAEAARHGDRHLGRHLGAGARDRPARRRPDHRAHQLELDLLHQRADRCARQSSLRSRRSTRVARHLARAAARPAGPAHARRSASSR